MHGQIAVLAMAPSHRAYPRLYPVSCSFGVSELLRSVSCPVAAALERESRAPKLRIGNAAYPARGPQEERMRGPHASLTLPALDGGAHSLRTPQLRLVCAHHARDASRADPMA
jgi:hypothetical protein